MERPVILISVEMLIAGGTRRVAAFVRAEKIYELLNDEGSLGAFLRDMRAAPEHCPMCGAIASAHARDEQGQWTWECSGGCNP